MDVRPGAQVTVGAEVYWVITVSRGRGSIDLALKSDRLLQQERKQMRAETDAAVASMPLLRRMRTRRQIHKARRLVDRGGRRA